MEGNEGNGVETTELSSEEDKPVNTWNKTTDPDLFYLQSSLGEHTLIDGELHYGKNCQAEIFVHMFTIPEESRGKRVGSRLLQSFVTEAKDCGATSLFGHITSEPALKVFGRNFGEENMKFFHYNQLTHKRTPLDLEYGQVMDKVEKGEKVDYGVRIDLIK